MGSVRNTAKGLVFQAALLLCVTTGVAAQQPVNSDREIGDQIRLVIRGDDFGSTHASNIALQEVFQRGIMTSASVMVPGPWFLETAALVRAHPEWTVGVHLTITSEWDRLRWRPVLPINKVPSLVAPDGFFYRQNYYWKDPEFQKTPAPMLASNPPKLDEVERELRAQIKRARASGIRVDYIDCHMGVACSKELFPVMKKLSAQLCLPIPEQGLLGEKSIGFRRASPTPETVKAGFRARLLSLKPGLWKLIGHPTVDDSEQKAIDSERGAIEAARRSSMLEAWKDLTAKNIIAERNIHLVSIRDLWDYENCQPK